MHNLVLFFARKASISRLNIASTSSLSSSTLIARAEQSEKTGSEQVLEVPIFIDLSEAVPTVVVPAGSRSVLTRNFLQTGNQ